MPNLLTESPSLEAATAGQLLSAALRRIRITGSMQYCFMPTGDWITDATPASYKPADAIGFHILAAGSCWVEIEGRRTILKKGDIAAFPFGTPHWIGSGSSGRLIDPGNDLPPKPWNEIPVLRYGDERPTRILCGYIQCEAMNFELFRRTLPTFIHVETLNSEGDDWLASVVDQIVTEVDDPRQGGAPMLERLTEVTFMEVLRRQFLIQPDTNSGWLAAIRDPHIGRCLALMHQDPRHDWTVEALARACALSRSALVARFSQTLQCSPIRYLRDWRLYLASSDLSLTDKPIGTIAHEAGYGTEAAFSRAFSRHFAFPPAEWRRTKSR